MRGIAVLALLTSTALSPQAQFNLLSGTFACVTHARGGTTWRFTTVNAAFGAWLRLHATFAPQNGTPARSAYTYLGYDPSSKRWNIVSMNAAGTYYTRYSVSPRLNGSRWVDAYPADGGKAVITIRSPRQYLFDFASPQDRSLTTCTRQT